MIVNSWNITGMNPDYEIAAQRAFFTGLMYLANVKEPEELFGALRPIDLIKDIEWSSGLEARLVQEMSGIMGSSYEAMVRVVIMNHLKYIAKKGYGAWFMNLKENREDEPLEFDFKYFRDGV